MNDNSTYINYWEDDSVWMDYDYTFEEAFTFGVTPLYVASHEGQLRMYHVIIFFYKTIFFNRICGKTADNRRH